MAIKIARASPKDRHNILPNTSKSKSLAEYTIEMPSHFKLQMLPEARRKCSKLPSLMTTG